MDTSKAILVFFYVKFTCLVLSNFLDDFKRKSRKDIGWSFEISIFQSCLKIGLTIPNLKAHSNLFEDIEKLQLYVPCLAKTLVPSFRSLSERYFQFYLA